ncbi:MAG: hypothetical protein QOH86_1200 [Sphingomonadales bacterium]|jgi:hypothetical protein|nr:hypothetical protein [Sphingomonadales bacterium]
MKGATSPADAPHDWVWRLRMLVVASAMAMWLACLGILLSLAFGGPPRWLVLALIPAAVVYAALWLVHAGVVRTRRRRAAR